MITKLCFENTMSRIKIPALSYRRVMTGDARETYDK
jgi:hypothetical protein